MADNTRYLVTVAITAVIAAAYGSVVHTMRPEDTRSLGFIVSVYFGAWSVYSLLFTSLTWTALRSADGSTLENWLTEDRAGRRRRRRAEWLTGTGGPLGALSFCAFAIGAVVCATVLPALRSDPLVIGLAVLVVASSWLLIVTIYAVHYARENVHLGGLRFSGTDDDGPPRFADYLYLSIQVSAAYNSADVTVTRRSMRRAVSVHAVVAFVFNTVLIALLVSLLVTVTT